MKNPADGNLWVDIYARQYDGEERKTSSKDMLTIQEAIEFLQELKERNL